MTGNLDWLVTWSSYVALAALTVGMLLVLVRLLLGPTLPDRIVALDTIAYLSIGFCAVWTVHSGHDAFLDAAATLALIAFLSTVAFARVLRRKAQAQNRDAQQAAAQQAAAQQAAAQPAATPEARP